jgi:hypothetical protein
LILLHLWAEPSVGPTNDRIEKVEETLAVSRWWYGRNPRLLFKESASPPLDRGGKTHPIILETFEKILGPLSHTPLSEDIDDAKVVNGPDGLVGVVGRLKPSFVLVKDEMPPLRCVFGKLVFLSQCLGIGPLDSLPERGHVGFALALDLGRSPSRPDRFRLDDMPRSEELPSP